MTTARVVGIDASYFPPSTNPDISLKDLREAVMEEIIQNVIHQSCCTPTLSKTIFSSPTRNFVIWGPGRRLRA